MYIALKTPADWATSGAINFADSDAAKADLLASFIGWDVGLRAVIAEADGELIPQPIHALPVGHCWDRTPGVPLLGDAAHLMSPFAGEGANLAIVAYPYDWEAALSAYERSLFPRSAAAAAESATNLIVCFRPDAPQGLLDLMAQYQAAGQARGR